MAVYTTQGSNPWGALGTIGTLAGAITGNPWLTAIGAGANAMSGNGGGAVSALGGLLGDAAGGLTGMINPGAGSMVQGYDAGTAPWADVFFKKNGGTPVWLQ